MNKPNLPNLSSLNPFLAYEGLSSDFVNFSLWIKVGNLYKKIGSCSYDVINEKVCEPILGKNILLKYTVDDDFCPQLMVRLKLMDVDNDKVGLRDRVHIIDIDKYGRCMTEPFCFDKNDEEWVYVLLSSGEYCCFQTEYILHDTKGQLISPRENRQNNLRREDLQTIEMEDMFT